MAIKIFLDSNIYLRFYDKKSSEYFVLLRNLPLLKDKLFVTQQIFNEVKRNSLNVALSSLELQIPTKFCSSDPLVSRYNEYIDFLQNYKTNILECLINEVENGTDDVSRTLQETFINVQTPTELQISKARERKELGNPPGKPNDPLGDQISWEQLLSSLQTNDELILVTNDNDFVVKGFKKVFLNPFLKKELESKKIYKIVCFNTFSEALKEIKKTAHELFIPENIKSIAQEETRGVTGISSFVNIEMGVTGMQFGTPETWYPPQRNSAVAALTGIGKGMIG
ncbi:MAG: PIN domain-containing protein [Candidatus Nanoarchaeia archaeon]|nr:PIN domain-containing protein [Candidatus Nanoarchaeia archaeon]